MNIESIPDFAQNLKRTIPPSSTEELLFLCIGTDRCTGDALGPLVGEQLEKLGYHVFGTLQEPLHAKNLIDRLQFIESDPSLHSKTIVAIDASLGSMEQVGQILVEKGPLKPGLGVHKILPEVGSYHIKGVVNLGGQMEMLILQSTRLHLVMELSKCIVSGIQIVFPLHSKPI